VCDGSGVVEPILCQNDAGMVISVFSRCFGGWLVEGGRGCVGSGGSKFRPRDRSRTQNFLDKIAFAVSTAPRGDSAYFFLNRPSSIIPTSYVTAPKKTYFYSRNADFEVLDREPGVLTVWPGVVAGSARGKKVVFLTIFRLFLDNVVCV
jgi:hypothetical protein